MCEDAIQDIEDIFQDPAVLRGKTPEEIQLLAVNQPLLKTLELQLDAPIIPSYSLGGFLLKTPICELTDILVGLGLWMEGCYELVSLFEARYRLGKDEVELAVDVRNGKLFKLTAYSGYRGRLFEKIAIAMRVQEAVEFLN